MVLDCKGQASLADAMFLLAIVSGLSALMFVFTTDYGMVIERTALEFYGTDYATSALQTVLYSSVPRHEDETLKTTKEVDYLLAFLKEDYANDRMFSDSTKHLLMRDINTTLASSLSSHDFIYIMHTLPQEPGEQEEFVYVLLKYAKYDPGPDTVKTNYYFCNPKDGMVPFIEEEFLSKAGRVVRGQPVILRFKVAESEEFERIHTSLKMWPSTSLPENVITSKNDLNCSIV